MFLERRKAVPDVLKDTVQQSERRRQQRKEQDILMPNCANALAVMFGRASLDNLIDLCEQRMVELCLAYCEIGPPIRDGAD